VGERRAWAWGPRAGPESGCTGVGSNDLRAPARLRGFANPLPLNAECSLPFNVLSGIGIWRNLDITFMPKANIWLRLNGKGAFLFAVLSDI